MADETHKVSIPIACHVCLVARKIIDYCRLIAAHYLPRNSVPRLHAATLSTLWNYTSCWLQSFAQFSCIIDVLRKARENSFTVESEASDTDNKKQNEFRANIAPESIIV